MHACPYDTKVSWKWKHFHQTVLFCFIHFDQVPYFIAPDPRSLPSIPENVSIEEQTKVMLYVWYPTKQVAYVGAEIHIALPITDVCVRVSVGLPEELDRADCGSRCGEPAPDLRQHAVWETHPHLCQQTQHCMTNIFCPSIFFVGFLFI